MKNKVVKSILRTLEKNGFEAYLVGGSVRDAILHRKTNDFDIATNALPQDLVKLFGVPKKTIAYGCYQLTHNEITIDITTYRLEREYQNRHPNITYTNNLLEDAKRRDFTMNAIYINLKGHKVDPYMGQKDIKKHKIVCIGNELEKITEDPLRILRAIRFASLLKFTLDKPLEEAIILKKEVVNNLSNNQIKKELDAIFLANGFYLLQKYQLDTTLNLKFTNITYVPDLAGLWVQVDGWENYVIEKELKNSIKKIDNIIKCGTISLEDLYKNGLYICLIAASILNIKRQKIHAMYRSLPIKSRLDIHISGQDLVNIVDDKTKIGPIIEEIERLIIYKKLKNNKKVILKEVERMIHYVND